MASLSPLAKVVAEAAHLRLMALDRMVAPAAADLGLSHSLEVAMASMDKASMAVLLPTC